MRNNVASGSNGCGSAMSRITDVITPPSVAARTRSEIDVKSPSSCSMRYGSDITRIDTATVTVGPWGIPRSWKSGPCTTAIASAPKNRAMSTEALDRWRDGFRKTSRKISTNRTLVMPWISCCAVTGASYLLRGRFPVLGIRQHRADRLAALGGSFRQRCLRRGHDETLLGHCVTVRRVHVLGTARCADELLLRIGRVETDELVDELAIPHRPRERAEDGWIAQRLRVLLGQRRQRDLLGELGGRDRHVLLLRERVEDEQRLGAALGRGTPVGADLILGLARLQQELLPRQALLLHPAVEVGDEV